MCYLKSVCTNENGEMEINQVQAKLLKKIKKCHQSYVLNCNENYKNAIAAIQSHYVAKNLKNSQAFSKAVPLKMIMINCAKYNG